MVFVSIAKKLDMRHSDVTVVYRERAKDLMPPGQESVVILIDYKTTTLRTNPSISTARKVSECILYREENSQSYT